MKVSTFAHTAELTLEIPDKHARGSGYAGSIPCDKSPRDTYDLLSVCKHWLNIDE
jgi:hypothetical protein